MQFPEAVLKSGAVLAIGHVGYLFAEFMLSLHEILALLAALLIARRRRLAIVGRRYLTVIGWRWLPDRHLAECWIAADHAKVVQRLRAESASQRVSICRELSLESRIQLVFGWLL